MCQKPIPGSVEFDYNPEQVTVSRATKGGQMARGGGGQGSPSSGSTGYVLRNSQQPKYDLKNVTFNGKDTKSRCEQLLDWMNPGTLSKLVGAVASAATGGLINLSSGLPHLYFIW